MARCKLCGKVADTIAQYLSLCKDCLREKESDLKEEVLELHGRIRTKYNLPAAIPRDREGMKCGQCVNDCKIGKGKKGYCGLITNLDGKLERYEDSGFLDFYFDPLPTNCVADWVCPGGSGTGFPQYAYKNGTEYGYKNLAVFFRHCTFNCLFCQNWHFRTKPHRSYTTEEIIKVIDEKTSCICYFGGDPTPNIKFALKLSEKIISSLNRIFRICWETNGSATRGYIKRMMELSLISGGILKIDLKAFSQPLAFALCGTDNKNTIANIEFCSQFFSKREVPPPLVVATLLIPGYIDEKELRLLAKFLASLDRRIPWALLGFAPHFYFSDLPRTSRLQASQALAIAKEYGMENCRIGNFHLLVD